MRTQEAGSKSVLLSSLSTSLTKTDLGIIQGADKSALPEGISLPKTDLGDEDGTSVYLLADYRLLQNVLPKRLILGRIAVEVVIKAFVVVAIDSVLPPAFLSLPEAPNYSKLALSNLIKMRTRG